MNIEELKLPYEFDQVVYWVGEYSLMHGKFKGVHIYRMRTTAVVAESYSHSDHYIEMNRVSINKKGAIEKYVAYLNDEFEKETPERKEKMKKCIEELRKENGLTGEGSSDE